MTESLHDQFEHSGHAEPTGPAHYHHPESDSIIRRCKERLYPLPSGRRLVDVLNIHHIPATVEHGKHTGYIINAKSAIVLTCPIKFEIPIDEMAIHLACGIRSVEMHMHQYISPEMKDSQQLLGAQLSEPFEIVLLICKLAYDLNQDGSNAEIKEFIARENYTDIYDAYKKNTSYNEMEVLMLSILNEKSKTDG